MERQIGCDAKIIWYSIGRIFRILRHILEPEYGETGLSTVQSGQLCLAKETNVMPVKMKCDFFILAFSTYKYHVTKYISHMPPLPGHC